MIHHKALIMVDLQNDFCPGGSLAVPRGDEIIALANTLQNQFDIVIATQDWHPADHVSFASQHPGYSVGDVISINGLSQMLWPNHCIQETKGAAFQSGLKSEKITRIFYKGTDTSIDSYSAFFDNARLRATGLDAWLREHSVDTVYIMGLATEYCVKYTALDAAYLGFKTFVIEDACRGIETSPGDCVKAFD